MAKHFSKKIERQILETLAMVANDVHATLYTDKTAEECRASYDRQSVSWGEPNPDAEPVELQGCEPSRMWLDGVEIPVQTINIDFTPDEEPQNPFAVIANWLRGNSEPKPLIPPQFIADRIAEMDEAHNKWESFLHGTDSILRDAPIKKPAMRTHFARVMYGDEERVVLYPYVREEDGSVTARDPLGFTIEQARGLYHEFGNELMAAERLACFQE